MKYFQQLYILLTILIALTSIPKPVYADNNYTLEASVSIKLTLKSKNCLKRLKTINYAKSEYIKDQMNPALLVSVSGTNQIFALEDLFVNKSGKDLLRFKKPSWEMMYYEINLNNKKIYLVFGDMDKQEANGFILLKDVSLNFLESEEIEMVFPKAILFLDSYLGNMKIFYDELELASIDGFLIKQQAESRIRITHRNWLDSYWEADINSKTVWFIRKEKDRKTVANLVALKWRAPISSRNNSQSDNLFSKMQQPRWPTDLGLKEGKSLPEKKSEWQAQQKRIFKKIIEEGQYDTFLVPVQVDGYAIDRTGRSLMTHFIFNRLLNYGYLLAPPSVVARALGEYNRIFERQEIYALAEQVQAKNIIMPLIGHDGAGEVSINFIQMSADNQGKFSDRCPFYQTNTIKYRLSDDRLAFENLLLCLDRTLEEIGFPPMPEKSTKKVDYLQLPEMPNTPLDMFSGETKTSRENAYFLQLLGILHPSQNPRMESLFERSLIAAWEIDKKSSDRSLLIARALLYLNRRPASLKFLGEPKTAEEKAFLAYLNGDLILLKEMIAKIKSPINKMISNIEYHDLLWKFTKQPLSDTALEQITNDYPGWAPFISRRLLTNWGWAAQPNIYIKDLMDNFFPIDGFTAKSLAESKLVLGESPFIGTEVELSSYNHYLRIIEKDGPALFLSPHITQPQKNDLLDLLYEISEANLVASVKRSICYRGLADEGLEIIRRYGPSYYDHPKLTYLKGKALLLKSKDKHGSERTQIEAEGEKLIEFSYFWPRGQVNYVPFEDFNNDQPPFNVFDKDFPKRYYWLPNWDGRAEVLENSLLYTNDNFSVAYRLYLLYERSLGNIKAKKLLERIQNRFIGSPRHYLLLSNASQKNGDFEGSERYIRKSIELFPDDWAAYKKLGEIHITKGELDKALEIFLSFPPFNREDDSNSVYLSNYAYEAAEYFYRLGLPEKANKLFEIAQQYQTGSSAEMLSAAYQNLAKGNYREAAYAFLRGIRRYKHSTYFAGYIKVLHVLGKHEEAWAIFDNIHPNKRSASVWEAAVCGLYIERISSEGIASWFSKQKNNKDLDFFLQRILNRNDLQKSQIPDLKNLKNNFLDLYFDIKKHDYDVTAGILDIKKISEWQRFLLPYMALYYYNFGKLEKFEALLTEYSSNYQIEFNQYLALGVVAGLNNDSDSALSYFNNAWLNIPFSWEIDSFIPQLFQLTDICDWFYKKTNDIKYLDACLLYAKRHNRKDPTAFWPYSFIAKYSDAKDERLKALGFLLYLDPSDEGLSKFPADEKRKAKELFRRINPFRLESKQLFNGPI